MQFRVGATRPRIPFRTGRENVLVAGGRSGRRDDGAVQGVGEGGNGGYVITGSLPGPAGPRAGRYCRIQCFDIRMSVHQFQFRLIILIQDLVRPQSILGKREGIKVETSHPEIKTVGGVPQQQSFRNLA
ncbi:hypothetical protein EVAR_80978_1 [Eumeta japonica]|uniref:Uncharacterized protein n=1 Tax=Eumeta variegata TaxID=151549 RepID=A0A4C1WNF9_EUMVA|nr:hypothetical protein EVAR_80978_1 [Eumeta japonica]